MIESLFTGCDTEGSGLVRVSKLIEYLSAVAGDNIEVSSTTYPFLPREGLLLPLDFHHFLLSLLP